ncbi:MAG: ABC transporter permease [Candidatus Dormibacteraeota bacterium]|uniref:ABC transporter permease n=1 Tax=Candidatus Dormiibacter inghamiae TaxID=3127013 RepID=A0A934NCD0_9BACT|nr:ABC transporter permease [Candidatus Dormibacteraeota bacterium]
MLRLRRKWRLWLPTAIGLAVAVSLATATVVIQSAESEAGLRLTVDRLGAQGRVDVALTAGTDPARYQTFQTTTETRVQAEFGGALALRSRYVISGDFPQLSRNGTPVAAGADLVQLASVQKLAQHVVLTSGSFIPYLPGELAPASVSGPDAERLGLKPGDTICLGGGDAGTPACVRLTALWRPRLGGDAYWDRSRASGAVVFVDSDPFFSLLAGTRGVPATGHAIFAPNSDAIQTGAPDQVIDHFRRLRGLLTIEQRDVTVTTNLDDALVAYRDRSRAGAFAIQLVAAQLLLIVLLAVAFLGTQLLRQQQDTIAVWRAKGWSWSGVMSLFVVELTLVAVPPAVIGAVVGWYVAMAALWLSYRPQRLPSATISLPSVGAAVLATTALSLLILVIQAGRAVRSEIITTRTETTRPALLSWWRRRRLDLLLGLGALPVLAVSVAFAETGRVGATPPLASLLLPGLALFLMSLAVVRGLPLIGRTLGSTTASVPRQLARIQLTRHPGQHAQLVVLLVLATATATFAGAYATTAQRNAVDRADYAVGADLRATFGGARPAAEAALSSLPGDAVPSAAYRNYANLGSTGSEAQILGVDPFSLKPVAWTRPDLAPQPFGTAMDRLVAKEAGGVLLPKGSRELAIWAYGTGTGTGVGVVARLSDGSGQPVSADFRLLSFQGWKHLTAPVRATAGPISDPIRFRSIDISPPLVSEPSTTTAVNALAAMVPGQPETILEPFESAKDPHVRHPGPLGPATLWWLSSQLGGISQGIAQPDLRLPLNGRPTLALSLTAGQGGISLRPPLMTSSYSADLPFGVPPIPALAATSTLARTGIRSGEQFEAKIDGVSVPLAVVATFDHFTTLYPENEDALVVARDPLLATLGQAGHPRPWSNELWVRTPNRLAVASKLWSAAQVSDVLDRGSSEQSALANPQVLALKANVVLGVAAAAVLAFFSLMLHFRLLTTARAAEYATLQANGAPATTIRRSLRLEQTALLGFCVVTGLTMGLGVAWSLLPSIQLGGDLSDMVPPTIVQIDPGIIALTAITAMALAVLGSYLFRAVSTGRALMDQVRNFE